MEQLMQEVMFNNGPVGTFVYCLFLFGSNAVTVKIAANSKSEKIYSFDFLLKTLSILKSETLFTTQFETVVP